MSEEAKRETNSQNINVAIAGSQSTTLLLVIVIFILVQGQGQGTLSQDQVTALTTAVTKEIESGNNSYNEVIEVLKSLTE
jgi:hypothetical protein